MQRGAVAREPAEGDAGAEELARPETGGLGAQRAAWGLSEGSAGQKWSPALTGSRALDQRAPVPEQTLLLLHQRAFAGPHAAPHDRLR